MQWYLKQTPELQYALNYNMPLLDHLLSLRGNQIMLYIYSYNLSTKRLILNDVTNWRVSNWRKNHIACVQRRAMIY